MAETKSFDEQFVLLDDAKRALVEFPYTVRLHSGELIRGFTDLEGRTERFVTDAAQSIEFHLGHHIE